MEKSYRKFYLLTLIVILMLSAYPLYLGVMTVSSYISRGYVNADKYPKYVIPYAPLCAGIILAVAIMPLIMRYVKKYALPAGTGIGMVSFAVCELLTEQIPVGNIVINGAAVKLETWQMTLCRSLTPEEIAGQTRVIGDIIFAESNPAFKFHFYLISTVILFAVVYIVYGFAKMIKKQDFRKRNLLLVQLICTIVFIGLCVLACLTAFYRTGDIQVSPVSAVLMCLFFIVLGVTSGTYLGCILYGKSKLLSIWIPAIAAMLITIAMYAGELMLMSGELFILGNGFIFRPIGSTPFAPADILVILLSGVITWEILHVLNRSNNVCRRRY